MPKLKPTCPRKTKNTYRVRGVSPVGGKVEELWRKGFVEKISFESGVEVMMMMCNVVVWDWQLDGMGITNETEKGMGIKSG